MSTRGNDNGDALSGKANGLDKSAASAKKALVVGINAYAAPNALPSCVEDARCFASLLKDSYGFTEVALRIDADATKDKLLRDLDDLLAGAKPGDRLVFYFSGHGFQPVDDGVQGEALVTQDSQFLTDREFAARLAAIPDGVLTIVLDACFSGLMEKAYRRPGGGVGLAKTKHWTPPNEEAAARRRLATENVVSVRRFGESGATTAEAALQRKRKGFADGPYCIEQLTDPNSKGLLFSACLGSEEAAASTPQSNGMSVFTFALLSAVRELGADKPGRQLLMKAGNTLKALDIGQTPMLKEPLRPQGLGSASFITLGGSSASGAPAIEGPTAPGNDEFTRAIAEIVMRILTTSNQKGVTSMSDTIQSTTAQKDWRDIVHVAAAVASMLQSKGFAPQNPSDKGWRDVVEVAVAVAGALQTKGFATQSSTDKGWRDVVEVAVAVAGALQTKGFATQNSTDKGWRDVVEVAVAVAGALQTKGFAPQATTGKSLRDIIDVAEALSHVLQSKGLVRGDLLDNPGPFNDFQQNKGAVQTTPDKDWRDILHAAVIVAGALQSKGVSPNGKNFFDDARNALGTAGQVLDLADEASGLFKGYQPDNKKFGDILDTVMTVAPLIASLQGKSFAPWTNGGFVPMNPPPFV